MAESEQKKIARLAQKQYRDWKEKRLIETGAIREPEKWIWVEHPTHSDWYNINTMGKFVQAAKRYKIDPYDFVALGISESGLGNKSPKNPTQVAPWTAPIEDMSTDELINFSAQYLAKQNKRFPSDKMAAIQAYSGTGRNLYGGRTGDLKFFGRPAREIDAWKEKPQAKRVMDISSKLRAQPGTAKLIEGLASLFD